MNLRREVSSETTSSFFHFLKNLEWVPTSLETKTNECLALLEHLRSNLDSV